MDLTESDVLAILNLIEKSSFDFFQLEQGDLKLTVSKGGYAREASDQSPGITQQSDVSPPEDPAMFLETPVGQSERKQPPDGQGVSVAIKGLVPIAAPMVGIFYAASEPEAPPFVERGTTVDEGTNVGLIEVMKVYTGISAGVRGVISEILVSNGQFVEYGQSLFLVKPEGSPDGEGDQG
ncbi:MAG: acetyl-CoA carboxylase biotin carboxyl carrier protein [Candidatus Binatia bacterium]